MDFSKVIATARRCLFAVDRVFRRKLPAYDHEGITLADNWRAAGSLRLLILFQGLVFWAQVALAPISVQDYDLFFHLAHGRYQDLQGKLPTEAYFSFLEPRPYLDYYWLYQRLIHELWQAAGPYGLVLLRGLLATLTLAGLALFLFGHRRSSAALLSSMLVFALIASRMTSVLAASRPYVFGYLCLLAMLWILEMRPRLTPLLPLIGLLWVNFHGVGYPVMLAVVLAYGGDEFLAGIRRGELGATGRQRLFWLAATLPTPLLSPHGLALLASPFKSTSLVSLYINEMARPKIDSLLDFGFGPAIVQPPFMIVSILLLLALAAILRRLRRRELRPVHLVLALAAAFLAFKGHRFAIEFALLLLPLLSGGTFFEGRRLRPLLAVVLVASASSLLCWNAAGQWIVASRAAYPIAFNGYPEGVATFLEKVAPPGGRILNSANSGGYLLWRLADRHRIMMDMELQALFRDEDFFLNLAALTDPAALRIFVEKYRPDWLAISYDLGRATANFLPQFPEFVPVAFDDELVLLVDRRRHPELAAAWRLEALDPWQAKADASYRLSPAAVVEAERLFALEKRGLRLPVLLAQAALARGDLVAAERYIDTLVEVCPDNADTWNLVGVLRLAQGDEVGAASALRKAVRRAGSESQKKIGGMLAHLLARQGDKKEALALLRARGLFYDPMPIENLALEVELLEELGPPAEAAAARRVLALRRGEALPPQPWF